MAIRLNYTGRTTINRSDVRITLQEQPGVKPVFDAGLTLDSYGLPPHARVCIEAYQQARWMRFDFGSVASLVAPADRHLTEFDSIEGILFRVKVTSATSRNGVLLAEADKIRPSRPEDDEEERSPLLPVKPDDLGHEIFRVDYTDQPMLLVNRAAGDWQTIARSAVFVSLVYPAVFREVLSRVLLIEKHFDTDDLDEWQSRWLSFAKSLPGVGDVPADNDQPAIEGWIGDAVLSFARQKQAAERFREFWSKENG
jgi:hypothetical protein